MEKPKDLSKWTDRPVDRALEGLMFWFMGSGTACSILLMCGVMALPVAIIGGISSVALFGIIAVRFARGSFGIPSESEPGAFRRGPPHP